MHAAAVCCIAPERRRQQKQQNDADGHRISLDRFTAVTYGISDVVEL